MNKNEFLKKLSVLIDDLPKVEKDRILTFYSETLEDHIEEGMTEEDAVASLEDVHEIADKILSENHVQQGSSSSGKNSKSATNNILLLIGSPLWLPLLLTFYLLAFVGYMLVWVLVSVMYVVVLCFAVSALACFFASVFLFVPHWLTGILAVGTGIFFVGLTIVAFYGVTIISMSVLKWSKTTWLKWSSKLKRSK